MKPMLSHDTAAGSAEGEIDIVAIWHELKGHKWLLVLTTFVCFAFGFLYALKQPVQYQSNLLLQVVGNKGGMDAGDLSKQIISGGGSSSGLVSTQIALIQSRFILEPVIQSLGLDVQITDSSYSKSKRFIPWVHPKTLPVSLFDVPREMYHTPFRLVVDKLNHIALYDEAGQLRLSGDAGALLQSSDGHIQLKIEKISLPADSTFQLVKFSSANTAKNLARSLKITDTEGKNRFEATGVLELSFTGTDKKAVLQILNKIAEIAREKSAQSKAEEASQTLKFLREQLPVTKGALTSAEKMLNQYRAKSGKIDTKIQTGFLLQQLAAQDNQLSELQMKKIEMKREYKKSHPIWQVQVAQVRAVLAQRKKLEAQLKKLPASDQVVVNLMRDVEVKQSLYLLLLSKIQALEVIRAGTVSDVRILSSATFPDGALPGKGKAILLKSALLGFMLGVMLIFGRKLLSSHVDDPYWSERYLNLPNVGLVPYCLEQKAYLISPKQSPLIAHLYSKSSATEALRSLRTSLQVTLATASNSIISILGIAPGVGKTFVSANLGYLLAAAGKRVLLVDSDLRKGSLHRHFNLKASPGLADMLERDIPVKNVLRETTHANLSIVPRGTYPKHPAELLGSERFKSFVAQIKSQYDVVLFDTAPVLLVTDAVLVASLAATNLIVFGSGVHEPGEIERAIKRLQNAGVSVSGSIFNFHKEQTKNYYYGKYYSDKYYYEDTQLEKALE